MITLDRLLESFDVDPVPSQLVDGDFVDTDRDDAASFKGIAWPCVSRDHWKRYWGAYSAFNPNAFRCYLPIIINCSSEDVEGEFLPGDWLLMALDTSADSALWDDFVLKGF